MRRGRALQHELLVERRPSVAAFQVGLKTVNQGAEGAGEEVGVVDPIELRIPRDEREAS
jgi:hypothetical protein